MLSLILPARHGGEVAFRDFMTSAVAARQEPIHSWPGSLSMASSVGSQAMINPTSIRIISIRQTYIRLFVDIITWVGNT